jgi:hypothetical protein
MLTRLHLFIMSLLILLLACSSPASEEPSVSSLTQAVLPTNCAWPTGVHVMQAPITVTANYPSCSTSYDLSYEVDRWDIGGDRLGASVPDVPPPRSPDPNCTCRWLQPASVGFLTGIPSGASRCSIGRYFSCNYGPRCVLAHTYWIIAQALTADWSQASLKLDEYNTGKTPDGHPCSKSIAVPSFPLLGP